MISVEMSRTIIAAEMPRALGSSDAWAHRTEDLLIPCSSKDGIGHPYVYESHRNKDR